MVVAWKSRPDWLMKQCQQAIPTEVGIVDIGVRVECRNEDAGDQR